MESRRKEDLKNVFRYVTPEEVNTAALELWEKIKPNNIYNI